VRIDGIQAEIEKFAETRAEEIDSEFNKYKAEFLSDPAAI
jgi:hypothetical protein